MLSALDAYNQTSIETASPGKLILMLYDGLISNCVRAKTAIEQNKIEVCHRCLMKSQDILMELGASLDMRAGEMAENLFGLYEFMGRRLAEANLQKDIQAIQEVIDLIVPIRDAWEESVVGKKE